MHVERLVIDLPRIVVVAEHCVEAHLVFEQRPIRLLELQAVVVRGRRPFVDVVAKHDDERIRERLAVAHHLRGNRELLRRASPAVANHRKLDGGPLVRQRQRLRTNAVERLLLDHRTPGSRIDGRRSRWQIPAPGQDGEKDAGDPGC